MKVGLSEDKILFMDPPQSGSSAPTSNRTVEQVMAEGKRKPTRFQERRLAPGEARTKLASLSFSSGTTGRPKVKIPAQTHPVRY